MVYFTRTITDTLGGQRVELAMNMSQNAALLERLEALGFVRCSSETFREAWRKNDARAFERMRAAVLMADLPRA